MIKKTKKVISIILTVMMVISCCTVAVFSTNAVSTEATASEAGNLSSNYATNPDNKVGSQKTITIDGSLSDWSEADLIAQGAAWDVANHWKGGHENCVLDTYSLYGAWDNENLYVAWQMVNTTDTWAREGDGPLSDGGRVLDVPLILALSVDPNSTSMSNKNTNGGSIWGQQMGITFDTHVDRLLYMSGKVGLGEPSMFKAVDAEGNTNYTDGCIGFAKGGIEYAMATDNIASSITGLNFSESPDDVFSDASDWVDFKTFEGANGVHNTKYDSFYEIKIPLSTLGVDANYISSNGIGAMLLATRGESALDCIPYDPSMVDNAMGSYSKDPSTSEEKEDIDVITVPLAQIGKTGSTPVTQPTTTPVTTTPVTTAPVTTEPKPTTTTPVGDSLTVNATSNLANAVTKVYNKEDKTVTVTYNLQSSEKIQNGEWTLNYDTSKLKISDSCYDEDGFLTITPTISKVGGDIINATQPGKVIANFTSIKLYNFTTLKPFVQVTFDVLGSGTTDVNLNIKELDSADASYNSTMLVLNSNPTDAFYSTCSFNTVLSEPSDIPTTVPVTTTPVTTAPVTTTPVTTAPVTTIPVTTAPVTTEPITTEPKPTTTTPVGDSLTVNATSNLANAVTNVYGSADKTVNVTYNLQCSERIQDGEWTLSYDSSKLKISDSCFDEDGNLSITPTITKVGGDVINNTLPGEVIGNFTSIKRYNFTTEQPFVNITFDVIGTGETDVKLYVKELDAADASYNFTRLVVSGVPTADFDTMCNMNIVMSTPTPLPTDEPIRDDQTKVIAKSNITSTSSQVYSTKSENKITVKYDLQSAQKLNNGQWQLTFDPAVLKLSDSNYDAEGNLSIMPVVDSTGNSVANMPANGRVKGNFAGATNCYDFTTKGTLVEVDFDILSSGTTTVNLDVQILSYLDGSNEVVTMVEDSQKTGNYNATGTSTLTEPTGLVPFYGDVNLDGEVNILDVTVLQQYIANMGVEFNEQQLLNANVIDADEVNVMDVTRIQMYIAKLITQW